MTPGLVDVVESVVASRRRWAILAVAGVLVSGVGPSISPSVAAAEVVPGVDVPGVDLRERPRWERPHEDQSQPAAFAGFGPAPGERSARGAVPGLADVLGVPVRLGGSRVAPLLAGAAWSWYLDPRVIEDAQATTFGALVNNGDLQVVQVRNSDGALSRFTLARGVSVDDHNAPAMLRTASGRYAALWSEHGRKPALLRVSRVPGSISEWGAARPLVGSGLERVGASYAVLFHVPGQQPDPYVALVRRRNDKLWVMTTSRDLQRWTPAFPLVKAIHPIEQARQPYLKFAYDGRTLHVVATDSQPEGWAPNKVYHFTIADGVVRRTGGQVVDTLANVRAGSPVDLRSTSLVYDGFGADGQARIYDLAVSHGGPIIALTSQATSARAYKWARFRNGAWQLRTLVRQNGRLEGMSLDSADPREVYLSYTPPGEQQGRIVHLVTADDGETWRVSEVGDTPGSRTPTTPYGSGGPWKALWLHGSYRSFVDYATTITGLTTGPRPVHAAVRWGRGWERGSEAVTLTVRQGYTAVPAVGVPIRAEVAQGGHATVRPVGVTDATGSLEVRFAGIPPGSTVRFVIGRTPTWGAAATASRRAG